MQVTQGNGVKTMYSYDANTRRFHNLNAVRQGNNIFQNLSYSYDKVGNILGLQNNVDVPPPPVYGGPTSQSFVYDDLYRPTHAQGTFQFSPSKTHTYTMDMGYDTIHNIASKNQLHTIIQPSRQAITQKKTSYNFAYAYNPSGAASIRPHAPTHIDLRTYTYDLDGNQTGWTHDQNGTRRNITWDDENRIQAVFDNGQEKDYKYDDQGQRVIKRGPQGETVYVNQFYTDRPGANATKHIYAGTTRIASKLTHKDGPNVPLTQKTPFEKDLFFYHPDHIGSTNYVTDVNGKLYEHLEYFPFGETWVEENSNQQRTPFLFSGKELDEETGLYYFGARYYDPRTSVWQSPDPILEKYLPTFRKGGELVLGVVWKRAMRKTIGLVFVTLASACFGLNVVPLEFKDVQNFSVREIRSDGSLSLQVSGLAFHSALAVDRIETSTENETMIIKILLVPTRTGLSGRFDYTVSVPPNIKRVLFGENRYQIWPTER